MEAPDFWTSQDRAKATIASLKPIKMAIKPFDDVARQLDEVKTLIELAAEEGGESMLPDLEAGVAKLEKDVDRLEFQAMMTEEVDPNGAFLSIHAGAGGTESCDWAEMLMRMYTHWAEDHGYELEMVDFGPGEVAGIRNVTMLVRGQYAYGNLRSEVGVHRLVRISPFDSNARRQTSFASIDLIPELDDEIEIDLKESDIVMETFMSGGPGGQHQNKTASGVRLRHLPSGVVAECRSERSQHKNRATCMKMLKSRLYNIEKEKRDAEIAKHYGAKAEISFGSQIRSYVLHPYQLVKDHRTDEETGNAGAVLEGKLDNFINAYLRSQIGKRTR